MGASVQELEKEYQINKMGIDMGIKASQLTPRI
jgi:hypothetical protein